MSARSLPPSVPVTVLRVYEPLEAFPAVQRRVLAALIEDPDAGQDAEEAERAASWRRLLGRRGLAEPAPAAGGGTTDGGGTAGGGGPGGGAAGTGSGGRSVRTGDLVRARVLRVAGAALLAPVADLDPGPVALGGPVHAPSGSRAPSADQDRPHTLVRAWELPLAWLTLVRSEDLTRSGGRGRYVLPMARARARGARALRTLRTALGDADLTTDVEGLARWLERFHPRSWVELDARPVAALVGGEDGAEDVRLGIEAMTEGDVDGLAAAYQRVSRRSHHLEQLSVSS